MLDALRAKSDKRARLVTTYERKEQDFICELFVGILIHHILRRLAYQRHTTIIFRTIATKQAFLASDPSKCKFNDISLTTFQRPCHPLVLLSDLIMKTVVVSIHPTPHTFRLAMPSETLGATKHTPKQTHTDPPLKFQQIICIG